MGDSSGKITIVISNYNYGDYVGSCIKSCLNQTYKDIEIIVVDDRSQDNSWKRIKKLAGPKVTCLKMKKNSGGNARGRNIGIVMSTGDWVMTLDSDDILLPKGIEHLCSGIDYADLVHGKSAIIWSKDPYDGMLGRFKKVEADTNADFKYLSNKKKVIKAQEANTWERWFLAVNGSATIVRRSVFDKIGLFDEKMKWKIDREMWHRILSNKYEQKFIDEWISIYRQHDTQNHRNRKVKNLDQVKLMFNNAVQSRKKGINNKNTMFPSSYDFESQIDIKVGGK